jgi:hypothetical protein
MRRAGLLIALLGMTAAACENKYAALTAPPPGLTARLDDNKNAIEVSTGVSLGFECTDSHDHPCNHDSSADDPGVALIFPAALDTLDGQASLQGPQPRSAFVVVGIAAGDTHVHAGGGSLSVRVLGLP